MEDMMARPHDTDEQLSFLSDLIAEQDTKIDLMNASVQQHSATFEMIQ